MGQGYAGLGLLGTGNGGTGVATFTSNGVVYGNGTGVLLVTAQGPANSVLTTSAGAPSFSATPTITSLTLTNALTVPNGGTGVNSAVSNGVLYGNGSGVLQATAQGAANSVLIASAGAPSFSAAPTVGTSVTTPLIIGGTAVSSTLSLRSTSGIGSSDAILFQVGNNGATEAMRITTGGLVGIGTSTIAFPFVINSSNGGALQISYTAAGFTSTDGFTIGHSGGDIYLNQRENAAIRLWTNGSERVVILSDGTLGVNTTTARGSGTIDVATNIFKAGTAYNNPDYVLEHWATGRIVRFADREGANRYTGLQPLMEVEQVVRSTFELPMVGEARAAARAGGPDKSIGLFDGGDAILASVEQSYLYLFDHEQRIAELSAEIARLRARLPD